MSAKFVPAVEPVTETVIIEPGKPETIQISLTVEEANHLARYLGQTRGEHQGWGRLYFDLYAAINQSGTTFYTDAENES